MKMKPILFSTPMVQAILEGRKTQTRRVTTPQPYEHHWQVLPGYKQGAHLLDTTKGLVASFYDYRGPGPHEQNGTSERNVRVKCRYGRPGDILYVRETWQLTTWEHPTSENYGYIYKASENGREWEQTEEWKWKPSLFMPKEAARIFLRITNIRVERLQDITEEDAIAEGITEVEKFKPIANGPCWKNYKGDHNWFTKAVPSFKSLWESINGPESWAANPFVWCITFERTEKPEKSHS